MLENILNTLEIGHVIELDFEDESGIVKTLKSEILDIPADDKCILSVPFYKGRFYPLQTGTRYKLYYNKRDSGVFQFQALVIGRDKVGNQHALVILRVSEFQKSQRRLYYRLPILVDALILVEDGVTIDKVIVNGQIEEHEFVKYKENKCSMKDISGGGFKLQSRLAYAINDTLLCTFRLGADDFKIKAVVRRCVKIQDVIERYDLGFSFEALEENDRSKIIAYIFDKQRNLLKKGML